MPGVAVATKARHAPADPTAIAMHASAGAAGPRRRLLPLGAGAFDTYGKATDVHTPYSLSAALTHARVMGFGMAVYYLNRKGELVLSLFAEEPRVRRRDRPRSAPHDACAVGSRLAPPTSSSPSAVAVWSTPNACGVESTFDRARMAGNGSVSAPSPAAAYSPRLPWPGSCRLSLPADWTGSISGMPLQQRGVRLQRQREPRRHSTWGADRGDR